MIKKTCGLLLLLLVALGIDALRQEIFTRITPYFAQMGIVQVVEAGSSLKTSPGSPYPYPKPNPNPYPSSGNTIYLPFTTGITQSYP